MNEDELLTWKNIISNQAKFVFVDLKAENINRYLAFDAINSRGLPLSEFDKIKNFCILVDNIRNLNTKPEKAWYSAITNLQKFNVSTRGYEAAFITDLFSAFHDQPTGQGDVHQNFVNKYRELLTASNAVLEADLKNFIELWEEYSKSFGFISTKSRSQYYAQLCNANAKRWLDSLDNMELPTITRMLLTASHLRMSQQDFEMVVKACEIYTFRVHAVLRYRKDKNSTGIIELSNLVLRNNKDGELVCNHICKWLGEFAPLDKVIKRLADGEPKYYHDFRMKGWSHCYYFLYEYELGNSPSGTTPISWHNDREGKINTQEHILPQEHRDGGWWEKEWADESLAEKYKHRLGNLVLTSNNSILGRKRIELKLYDTNAGHYYNHRNASNSEKQIKEFTDGNNWKVENILMREFELLKFASQRWNLPCCIDNGIINLPDVFMQLDDTYHTITINESNCFSEYDEESNDYPLDEDDLDEV